MICSECNVAVSDGHICDLIIASDIAKPAATITSRESLLAAINKMMAGGSRELVVVEEQDAAAVIGTLSRGDIISTGTPAGVGSGKGKFLRPGQRIDATIQNIGTLTNVVVDET